MDSVSPQDVYARHLVSRRGYPLWTPEPSLSLPDTYRRQGLQIGDVGVVVPDDGSFDVLFNICLPPTHALHRDTGVPDNFAQVSLEDRDIAIFPEAESAGRIISSSSVARVGRQASDENTTRQLGPLNYEFTLSSKEGALLILPEGAERYYLRNQRPFLEEAIQHAVDWYNFAEQRLGRIISHDSLYLITGFYKARSWSLASYQHASGSGLGAYAQFKAVQVDGGNVSTSYTWETTRALDWRVGPSNQYYNGMANQSVFIQGFKIAVRSSILGAKRVKVKADIPAVRPHKTAFYNSLRWSDIGARLPSSWSGSSAASGSRETEAASDVDTPTETFDSLGTSSDDDEDVTVQHIPQVAKPFHPSDIINEQLLQLHPSAVIAITHDTQWTTLLEHDFFMPEVLGDSLKVWPPCMFAESREGVVYLKNIETVNTDNQAVNAELPSSGSLINTEGLEKRLQHVDKKSPRPDNWHGDFPNSFLGLPHDIYESGSSMDNPSKVGKNVRSTEMFKQQPSFTSSPASVSSKDSIPAGYKSPVGTDLGLSSNLDLLGKEANTKLGPSTRTVVPMSAIQPEMPTSISMGFTPPAISTEILPMADVIPGLQSRSLANFTHRPGLVPLTQLPMILPRKKNTIYRACDACRSRKIRCERIPGQEKCQYCLSRNHPCTHYVQQATSEKKRNATDFGPSPSLDPLRKEVDTELGPSIRPVIPMSAIQPEMLTGISMGFTPPVISTKLLPMADTIPSIITLPYGKAPVFHVQAPSWQKLLTLMGSLSATRIEPTVDAISTAKHDFKLRTVIQFVKVHPSASEWRTVLYLTTDYPVPPNLRDSHKYTSDDVGVLPYSYTLSSLPSLLRNGPESPTAKYYVVPSSTTPYPGLPISFPGLAMYLESAVQDSRRATNDSSSGLRKLAQYINTCYQGEVERIAPIEQEVASKRGVASTPMLAKLPLPEQPTVVKKSIHKRKIVQPKEPNENENEMLLLEQ